MKEEYFRSSRMRVEHHITVSAAVSGMLYLACPSWQMAVAAFLAGVAIDVDHVIDYLVEFGTWSDWRSFVRSFDEGRYVRIFIVFHAWEWLFALGAVSWLTEWNPWVVGIQLGATQHLILDQLTNGASGLGYSLLWRWSRGFAAIQAFPYKNKLFR